MGLPGLPRPTGGGGVLQLPPLPLEQLLPLLVREPAVFFQRRAGLLNEVKLVELHLGVIDELIGHVDAALLERAFVLDVLRLGPAVFCAFFQQIAELMPGVLKVTGGEIVLQFSEPLDLLEALPHLLELIRAAEEAGGVVQIFLQTPVFCPKLVVIQRLGAICLNVGPADGTAAAENEDLVLLRQRHGGASEKVAPRPRPVQFGLLAGFDDVLSVFGEEAVVCAQLIELRCELDVALRRDEHEVAQQFVGDVLLVLDIPAVSLDLLGRSSPAQSPGGAPKQVGFVIVHDGGHVEVIDEADRLHILIDGIRDHRDLRDGGAERRLMLLQLTGELLFLLGQMDISALTRVSQDLIDLKDRHGRVSDFPIVVRELVGRERGVGHLIQVIERIKAVMDEFHYGPSPEIGQLIRDLLLRPAGDLRLHPVADQVRIVGIRAEQPRDVLVAGVRAARLLVDHQHRNVSLAVFQLSGVGLLAGAEREGVVKDGLAHRLRLFPALPADLAGVAGQPVGLVRVQGMPLEQAPDLTFGKGAEHVDEALVQRGPRRLIAGDVLVFLDSGIYGVHSCSETHKNAPFALDIEFILNTPRRPKKSRGRANFREKESVKNAKILCRRRRFFFVRSLTFSMMTYIIKRIMTICPEYAVFRAFQGAISRA